MSKIISLSHVGDGDGVTVVFIYSITRMNLPIDQGWLPAVIKEEQGSRLIEVRETHQKVS